MPDFGSMHRALLVFWCAGLAACGDDTAGSGGAVDEGEWGPAEIDGEPGFRSSVWGSSARDVFVVGGSTTAQIYHFDGASWDEMTVPAQTPPLIWVFGFGARDVYSVGLDGTFLHYDGVEWTALDSGTAKDLWGIWGTSPSNMWLVGGEVNSGDPAIIHWNGSQAEPLELDPSQNPDGASALFKVWGIGSKVLAVGQDGLIIEYDGSGWVRVPAGDLADGDFISLWGTTEDNIVVVGGRTQSRIARYNGTTFDTIQPADLGGTNASFMCVGDRALVGGAPGYVGSFDLATGEVTLEYTTLSDIHAVWSDCRGTTYAVGGLLIAGTVPGIVIVKQ